MEEKEGEAGDRAFTLVALLQLAARNRALFAVTTALCLAASVAWLTDRDPIYRAKATLVLEDEHAAGGLLGDLAALAQAPRASAEMELLRARTTIEAAVEEPRDATPVETRRHAGLRVLVDDPELHPLHLVFGDKPSVAASALDVRVEHAAAGGAPRALLVEILAGGRARVGPGGWRGRLGIAAAEAVEVAFGERFELDGLALRLAASADLAGRRFEVRVLGTSDAVQRVARALRVRETERGSNVVELVYDDSDPERAAATANALCWNYLERNRERGTQRASQTLGFIRAQLATQMDALHAAESDLVAVQRENPHAIDVSAAAEALIGRASDLDVQRARLRLATIALRDALERLAAGDAQALSRLPNEAADPIAATYVEAIARLQAERELLERADASAYKTLLQEKALQVEVDRDALEVELAALRSAREALAQGAVRGVARLGAGQALAADPLLARYLEGLAGLEAERDALAREFTAAHPDLAGVDARIAAAAARIDGLLAERVQGLEGQRRELAALASSYRERIDAQPQGERERVDAALDRLRARTAVHLEGRLAALAADEASIAREIAALDAGLGELPEEERRVADPLRRTSAHAEIVKFLLTREQEAEIARASTVASAGFIDPAAAPERPYGPSIPVHLALGLLAGVALSIALAFAKESLGRGVFTEAELETSTELPVLGSVPDFRHGRFRVRGASEDFLPLRDDPEGMAAEAYRSLRANLKFALSGERELKTLSVTSCAQGEGKSLTNVSLAMSFARSGRKVALVDCDMRRPSVERYLGIELSPGLSDVLQGRASWRGVLRRGVEENFDVITAGEQPRSPSDLLDGQAFSALLAELEREYDLIVVDVPPALSVSDIESIAARLDALILVCRSNRVPSRLVAATARRLRQAGAHLIGTVLNAVGNGIANGRYGYGYGYGYGHAKRDGSARRAGAAR